MNGARWAVRRWRRAGAAVFATCALAAAAPAQPGRIIRGTVLDVRDQPVALVAIIATGAVAAITDDSGRFRLEISHRDKIVVDARRVGFMPSRVGLGPGGDTSVSVLLLPSAQRLPGVDVNTARTAPPSLAGFEQRMLERRKGAGAGHFITAKDIEQSPSLRATQVVENVSSIFVRRVGGDRFAIFGKTVGGVECPATVYLDGIRLTGGGQPRYDARGRYTGSREPGAPIDEYVTPPEIAGVEIYARGVFAPPQFQPASDANAMRCAIVAFWTKHS